MEEEVYMNFKNGESPALNDENLNQLQKLIKNDIKESGVTISSTEPTENNRKKVWIKHSKNIYVEQEVKNGLWNGVVVVANNSNGWYVVVPIHGGNTYTISRKNGKADNSALSLLAFSTNVYPANNIAIIDSAVSDSTNGKQVTIETTSEANYLFIGVATGISSIVTEEVKQLATEELQVELGNTKTEYEEPMENDVLVKEDKGYNSIFPKTIKILDTTNVDYNIQVKAYKNGKVVTVTLYTTSIGQEITNGAKNILLAQLGEKNGPLETIDHMLATQLGVRFNIRVYENGNINISHVYNTMGRSSQIVQMFTYVTK